MKTLRETVADAKARKVAVGHFNVSDSNQFAAIIAAAEELKVPVIIGATEGEQKFLGTHEVAALVHAAREKKGLPVYLNSDHTRTIEGMKAAIDAGFDAVLFDGAKETIEKNIELVKEAVAYAKASGRDVMIEGELGYIGSSSQVHADIPEGAGLDMTTPELATRFITETGIDLLAPSVGNIHGLLKNRAKPALDLPRIEALGKAISIPMVLHGASGETDADVRGAIERGVAIVHVNTEIRVAYKDAIAQGLAANPEEVAPYKYLLPAVDAVKQVVLKKLKVFNGL
jgi:fructose-bisphosphate aldolase, class II